MHAITKTKMQDELTKEIQIEYPTGKIPIEVTATYKNEKMTIPTISYYRTARPLIEGHAFVKGDYKRYF